ncbi:MAG: TusE/DsrC/DsvC family sulfur relay protein [Deltaproteobacteria bacterium]|nr:TusE/DsrC/DsvC family sulfur relay protein [Deltaproteobacteria bacterium]
MATENEKILARLDAISQQLEVVAERQRFTEELVEEMTPIARLVMSSATTRLSALEERGVFDMLAVTQDAAGRVLDSYTKDDAQHLADAIVGILGTVRNLTQPGVLQLANQATDVLRHADGVKPVGMFGAMRKASSDKEIQRGLGVMLEILRAVGRTQGGSQEEATVALLAPEATASASAPAATQAAAPPKAAAPPIAAAPAAPEAEVIHWEGHDFDPNGFLIDPNTWTPELAGKIASGLGITLTEEHMHVLEWVRDDYASSGASPNVRRVATGSGAGTQNMYKLFPPTPGKSCAMIAGVPKPVGCV